VRREARLLKHTASEEFMFTTSSAEYEPTSPHFSGKLGKTVFESVKL
jgi:hypothetical protein